MNIGEYLIEAGAILGIIFRTSVMQQIAQFVTSIGTAMGAGYGSIPAFRLGNFQLGPIPIAPIGSTTAATSELPTAVSKFPSV